MSHNDAISIDEIIERALSLCKTLPPQFNNFTAIFKDCKNRLSLGTLHLAVMGMFKRGKSSFINSLLGNDLLPTSVVPVTSIPTTIKYGNAVRCLIRFFNKNPDLVVQESITAVHNCLMEHVTEEHNPLNNRCVDETIVEYPHPLLKNGTIFVDTPGFGSTYTHNTKTTLDLLRKCDAVLFLLSPDPPFTLTEVEFLKEVLRAVPRIFFILNKIDLLTIDDLKKIDGFIQSILSNNLGFPRNTRMFHVSAKMGRSLANRPENDPSWSLSGMAAIRTEIIDFMVKEKYFTLSQAIRDKCRQALTSIQERLDIEHRELLSPAEDARRTYESMAHSLGSIRTAIDKEIGMMNAEMKAFGDFAEKTIDSLKGNVQRKAGEALRVALESAPLKRSELSRAVYVDFDQYAGALFDHFFLQVVSAINKPLRKAITLHVNEFAKIREDIVKENPSASLPVQELDTLADDLEIKADSSWKLEGVAIAFHQIKLPFIGFFKSDAVKRQRYYECFSRAVTEIMTLNIFRFSKMMKELVLASCKKLKTTMSGRSEELLKATGQAVEEKKKNVDNLESTVAARVKEIEEQKAEVKEVEKLLV